MKLLDQMKFVVGAPPFDVATALDNTTYLLGNAVNVKLYNHVTIVMIGGVFAGGANACAVTIKQAETDAISVASDNVPISYRYLCTATSAQSDTWVKTAVTSNTWTWAALNHLANIVEFDTAVLNEDHDWIAVNTVAAGASALMSVLYILSNPRYAQAEDTPTSLT